MRALVGRMTPRCGHLGYAIRGRLAPTDAIHIHAVVFRRQPGWGPGRRSRRSCPLPLDCRVCTSIPCSPMPPMPTNHGAEVPTPRRLPHEDPSSSSARAVPVTMQVQTACVLEVGGSTNHVAEVPTPRRLPHEDPSSSSVPRPGGRGTRGSEGEVRPTRVRTRRRCPDHRRCTWSRGRTGRPVAPSR